MRMLYKKGERMDPANYRPIALMNCIAKIFMQILSERVRKWVENKNFLPEWQNGFRKERGCIDNIFVLNAIIQTRLSNNKGKLFVLFVDFKSAFPSVNHNLLWEKLDEMGFGNKIINLLKNLYSKSKISVKNSVGISKKVAVTKGVLLGKVLSPILLACFMSDFEKFLKEEEIRGVAVNHLIEILMLAYADDIAIFDDSVVEMRKIVLALIKYCKKNT